MKRIDSSRRRFTRASALLVPILLGALAARAPAEDKPHPMSPEDSVRAVETARGQALVSADTVALSRMIAGEFIEISRFGQIRSKADNMHDIASGELKLTSVKYDSLAVRIYGNVALLTGIADNVGAFRGFPFTGKIRYSRLFVRRDGRWQAVAMQHTPMQ